MSSDLPAIGISMFSTDRSIHPVELATAIEARGFAASPGLARVAARQ